MLQAKLTVLLVALSPFLAAQTDPPGRVGRLNYINGPVSFQPAGVTDWVDADINRPLTTGDQVWVGDGGRAEIHVGSTALRLDSNTAFQFLNLDDQTIQIQLSQGTLTVRVRNLAQYQNLELDTPSLAFTVLRPGEYRIGADPDSQTTTVTVRDGDGEVTGGGRTFPVHARQQAIVVGADQITYDLVSAPGADGWDQWNSSRDRREDQSPSARYVSREMDGYEDLDQYGSWANQPGYGQVWMPPRSQRAGRPITTGIGRGSRPGVGPGLTTRRGDSLPTTMADGLPSVAVGAGCLDRMGKLHYMRRRWWGGSAEAEAEAGSGFSVSFSFGNAAAVGWFPLGPREPYFPAYSVSSGYFGRVNHTNTVINNTVINNYYSDSRNHDGPALNNIRYANRDVRNAVTAVPQDKFANGRRVAESGARPLTGAQLGTARFAAAPEIAPQRASVLGPRAGEASRSPRPPAAVLSRPVVARTAPPPASVPFERQQAELNQNPGRPLPPATVQQLGRSAPARSSPVRVEDMSQVQRVQPTVGAGPQRGSRQANPASRLSGGQNPQPSNAVPPPDAAPRPVVNNQPSESPSNPGGRQNGRLSPPVARPDNSPPIANPRQQNAPPPNVVPRPNAPPPPPVVNNRPSQSPSDPGGKQNGRWSAPVARPDSPPPNANPRQQNAPPPNVVQRPNAPPAPPAANNRPSGPPSNPSERQNDRSPAPVARPNSPPPNANPRQQNAPPPNVVPQPNAPPPPPVVNNRPSESPSNPGGRQNGRLSAPVARPVSPPPNANPRQQNVPPPNAVQRPNAAPAPPTANNRPSGPPPGRQQPEQRDKPATSAQPSRPQAQNPQPQPPAQVKEAAAAEARHPASRAKGNADKPDKTDEKK